MRRTAATALALAIAAFMLLCGATEASPPSHLQPPTTDSPYLPLLWLWLAPPKRIGGAFVLWCGSGEGAWDLVKQGAALSCPPGNYTSTADGVSSCVACEAGTFKPFDGPGACLSCPGDEVSAEEGRSCACGVGLFFEDNVPMLSCSGEPSESCPCTPSVGSNRGTLSFQAVASDMGNGYQPCASIIISGVEPRVTVTSLQVQNGHLVLRLDECDDEGCTSYTSVGGFGMSSSGWEYQSRTRHLRVSFEWSVDSSSIISGSLVAAWSTTSKPPGCAPCEENTYKDTTDAAACTACPSNAVSAEGSTSLSACTCPAGFTGDAGSGVSCGQCGPDTYKDVHGSASCSVCPSNAVSAEGNTDCVCPEGYSGDAGAEESCVACEAGTFKPFEGPGACLSCPGDGVSAEEGKSCACGAGHFFEDNVPMLSCSGGSSESCLCTPSVGLNDGTLSFQADASGSYRQSCSWTISGVAPRMTVTSLQMQDFRLNMYLDECDDADCMSYQSVRNEQRDCSLEHYQQAARVLAVRGG
ncbi:hypothetical protein T484DRAFT_1857322 [Baffinella frigidus]|nr:hypothetical protein T484DRAFT_1857322 [Cryptophyta sp. CCMP2293]